MALLQGGLAATMVGALWMTGLALGLLHIGTNLVHHATIAAVRVLYIAPIIVASATLFGLLLTVEIARIVLLIKEGPAKNAASTDAQSEAA
jgi:hypothetical protein